MDDIRLAVQAATLLGRWTLISEKHANGCSCCPGLGDVTMEQVEGSVLGWLRERSKDDAKRHVLLRERGGVTQLLKDCIGRSVPADAPVLQPLFKDLGEALDHLEQVQRGF
jgi:hypothetical protein